MSLRASTQHEIPDLALPARVVILVNCGQKLAQRTQLAAGPMPSICLCVLRFPRRRRACIKHNTWPESARNRGRSVPRASKPWGRPGNSDDSGKPMLCCCVWAFFCSVLILLMRLPRFLIGKPYVNLNRLHFGHGRYNKHLNRIPICSYVRPNPKPRTRNLKALKETFILFSAAQATRTGCPQTHQRYYPSSSKLLLNRCHAHHNPLPDTVPSWISRPLVVQKRFCAEKVRRCFQDDLFMKIPVVTPAGCTVHHAGNLSPAEW